MKTTELTVEQLAEKLNQLSKNSFCFIDEIPEVLQDDFKQFIIGHTISEIDGRAITYDMKMYADKVMYGSGIGYPVQFGQSARSFQFKN